MARYQMLPRMGGHYLRQKGKTTRINPGDIIDVEEHELRGAADKFTLVDPPPEPPPELEPTQALYAKHVGGGRWNVINPATDKPINDELLSKEEAQSLVDKELPETEEETDAGADNGNGAQDDAVEDDETPT